MTEAERIFHDIKAAYPDAEEAVKTANSLTMFLGGSRDATGGVLRESFRVVSSIGQIHHDPNGKGFTDWKGIIKSEVDKGFAYRVDLGGYTLLLATDGTRRLYPRAGAEEEYLELGLPQVLGGDTWSDLTFDSHSVDDATVVYTSKTQQLRIRVSPSGVKVDLVLLDESLRVVTGFRFPFVLVGFTMSGRDLISDRTGELVAVLPEPSAHDAKGRGGGERGGGEVQFDVKSSAVSLVIDISEWAFPVTIDPTVYTAPTEYTHNFRFDAVGNAASFNNGEPMYWGLTPFNRSCGMLFPGVALDNAVTIIGAYISGFASNDQDSPGTVNSLVRAQLATNPSTCTDNADARGRTRTSTSASWAANTTLFANGTTIDTPSLVAPMQELINQGGWANGNNQLWFIDWNLSGTHYCTMSVYDSGNGAPTLVTDYSTASPFRPSIIFH